MVAVFLNSSNLASAGSSVSCGSPVRSGSLVVGSGSLVVCYCLLPSSGSPSCMFMTHAARLSIIKSASSIARVFLSMVNSSVQWVLLKSSCSSFPASVICGMKLRRSRTHGRLGVIMPAWFGSMASDKSLLLNSTVTAAKSDCLANIVMQSVKLLQTNQRFS